VSGDGLVADHVNKMNLRGGSAQGHELY
jgi:hypothetical protein